MSALEEYQLAKEMFNECVLSETADAAIAELEAALAALKARRCENCAKQDSERCPVHDVEGEHNEWVHQTPPDFACNRWTSRAEEGRE